MALVGLLLGGCQGQFSFQWGSTGGGPRGALDLCQYFSGITDCGSGERKDINLTSSLARSFDQDIHPQLLSSCRDCHQTGKLKGDAPFANESKTSAFPAALTRFKLIEEKLVGNHQVNSWSSSLRTNRGSFVSFLQDYIQELCEENPDITYCSQSSVLSTASVDFTGPLATTFSYVRFNITSLVYPAGLPNGKFPVFAEVGLTDVAGQVAFGEVRVFSPSDDLTLTDLSVEHSTPEGAQIVRKFPQPQAGIGVTRATTTTLPPVSSVFPGASLTGLLSAPLSSAFVQPSSPLRIALRFGGIRLGLPGTVALTPRERFDQGVVPILQRSCMGCHNVTRNTYTMFPADSTMRYTNSRNRVIARNFAGSLLIQRGTGTNHGGGNAFNFGVNTADRAIVEAWINSEQ